MDTLRVGAILEVEYEKWIVGKIEMKADHDSWVVGVELYCDGHEHSRIRFDGGGKVVADDVPYTIVERLATIIYGLKAV